MKQFLSLTILALTWTVIMCQDNGKGKNLLPHECGYRNINGLVPELSGDNGIQTKYGEFPWMAIILEPTKTKTFIMDLYQCGGSIIHPRVVLVAADCVYSKRAETLKIKAGKWDTQRKIETFPVQVRNVSEIIIHENFNRDTKYNNIALLILTEPFEMNESVSSVCLPPANTQFDNQKCLVTGWGKNKPFGNYQVIMTKIDLSVIPRDLCQSSLRKSLLGPNYELHSSFICTAGTFGNDTCKGYGGSPLACPIVGENDRYYQAGVMNYGVGCTHGNPRVHTSVAELRPWIDKQLKLKQIEKAELPNNEVVVPKPTINKCGHRNSKDLGSKLTGVNENEAREFPWMVDIMKKETNKKHHFIHHCSGSIIHPSVVLTTAHCVTDVKSLNELIVNAGEWHTQGGHDAFPIQYQSVAKIIIHKNFNKGAQHNNIALLILSTPFEFTENVHSICLPPANTQFDENRCVVTGKGVTRPNGEFSKNLTKLDLSVIPRDQCQSALRKTKVGRFFKLHSSFICTEGTTGKDTCSGFGGSPLACPIVGESDLYYQAGMVSWGIGCANGNPGVYVNIANLRPWIDDQLKLERIDSTSFTPELTNAHKRS